VQLNDEEQSTSPNERVL
jgi:hypothetical protein